MGAVLTSSGEKVEAEKTGRRLKIIHPSVLPILKLYFKKDETGQAAMPSSWNASGATS